MSQYETMEEKLERLEKERDAWMEDALQAIRNTGYYRGLLDKCAPFLGKGVYTCKDGTVVDEPLRAKIPELVERMYLLLGIAEDKGE